MRFLIRDVMEISHAVYVVGTAVHYVPRISFVIIGRGLVIKGIIL
jgi:hypothetical protein